MSDYAEFLTVADVARALGMLTVADVARILGISEKHVKQIPVVRHEYQGIPGSFYKMPEVTSWRDRDLASPTSLLRRLRTIQEAIRLRELRRSIQHTKTGKLKKRFREQQREAPYQSCSACGGTLVSEVVDYLEEPYEEEDHDQSTEWRLPGNSVRAIPVERKGAITHNVRLDVDQVLKNAKAASHIRSEPKLVQCHLRYCKNPKCTRYNEPVEQHELEEEIAALDELFWGNDEEIDERSIQAEIDEINGNSPEGNDE